MPLEPIDLSGYSTISEITVTFSWDIDGAITYVDDRHVMADRTGTGICLDFDVGLVVSGE